MGKIAIVIADISISNGPTLVSSLVPPSVLLHKVVALYSSFVRDRIASG